MVDGDDVEESEEFLKVQKMESPTRSQRERHELENHAVFRPWCAVCVKGRGVGSQHKRKRKQVAEASRDGATIYSDYFFMSSEDAGSEPMLVMKYSRSGRLAATALPAKGVTDFGVKTFKHFIQSTGVRSFVNMSDNENSIVALKEAAARACEGVEAIARSIPVGDHKANGHAESAVKQVKGMMRAVRLAMESKLGERLPNSDCILKWLPSFSADIISKVRKTSSGRTPYEMEMNRKWDRPMLEFGERFMMKEAIELSGRPKRDWDAKMIEAVYVGHHSRSNAVMGLTESGVKFGHSASRLPERDRWSTEVVGKVKGVPWDLHPDIVRPPRAIGERVAPKIAVLRPDEVPTRSFYVQQRDIERHGYTPTCPGCAAIKRGASRAVAHSVACRERIVELIEKDDEDRILRFFARVKDKEEMKRKKIHEPDPEVDAGGNKRPPRAVENVLAEEEMEAQGEKRAGDDDDVPVSPKRQKTEGHKRREKKGG